jgi:hypothetical protein
MEMVLLEGSSVWNNLKTSFINLDELLLFLKRHGFNGYFYFEFSDCECVLFLHEGDVVNGIEERLEQRRCGQHAVKKILQRSQQDKHGTISVTQLPSSTVGLLANVYGDSVKLLPGESGAEPSRFVGYISLLKKEGFSGYLELYFPADETEGITCFKNGKIKSILTEDLLADLKEESEAELKFIQSFIESAQHKGVRFRTYTQE